MTASLYRNVTVKVNNNIVNRTMTFAELPNHPPLLTDVFTPGNNTNTNFLKRSFSYRAAKSWTGLSDEIKNNFDTLSLASFKRRLNRVLL